MVPMHEFHLALPSAEIGELGEELDRLFADLDRTLGLRAHGECRPALDVVETDEQIEIVVDVPGMAPSAVRVVLKSGLVIIAGQKSRAGEMSPDDSRFHLVERVFGRFARVVRLTGAFDGSRVRVTIDAGERRGRRLVVPIGPSRSDGDPS
jgi:HSP20 family protein